MITDDVREFAEEAIRRLCDRCRHGDGVWHEKWIGHGNSYRWLHSYDNHDGIKVLPEMCKAQEIREMLHEWETAVVTTEPTFGQLVQTIVRQDGAREALTVTYAPSEPSAMEAARITGDAPEPATELTVSVTDAKPYTLDVVDSDAITNTDLRSTIDDAEYHGYAFTCAVIKRSDGLTAEVCLPTSSESAKVAVGDRVEWIYANTIDDAAKWFAEQEPIP